MNRICLVLIALLVLASSAFMASCSRGGGNNSGSHINTTSGTTSLVTGVSALDSSTTDQVAAADDSSVTLNGTPAATQTLKPGDIFIVQNTARKVESVSIVSGQTIITTVEPELHEVVSTIDISGDVILGEEHIAKASVPSNVRLSVNKSKTLRAIEIGGAGFGNTFTYTFADYVIDGDGDENTTYDQVLLNGDLVLDTPRITFLLKYGIISDKYAEIRFNAAENLNLSLSSQELTFDKKISIPLGALVIPIAVTGGTVNVTVSLNLVFEADGKAKISTGFYQNITIDAGMTATVGPANVTSFNNSAYDWNFQPPQLEGELNASAAVNPDVDLKFLQYTLAGINNSLAVKATVKANLSLPTACYRISEDANLSSIAFVMLPKAAFNLGFSWDGVTSGLDLSMEKYPKELFTYTKRLYDSGNICTVTNAAPIADAGADKTTNAKAAVSLAGTGSHDQDGTIVSYLWTQIGGPSVVLTDAGTATPSFTAPANAGALSFRLTVTDNKGDTATDDVTVNVLAGETNFKPIADAGSDQTVIGSTQVFLNGSSSSDSDGSIASYQWVQTGGTPISLTNADSVAPSFTAPSVADTVTLKLTVTDNKGATATDYVQVVVAVLPSTPTGVIATAGDAQVTISWTAVSGATSYNIYWSTANGVTKSNGTKISNPTSPYFHTGRTNSTTYYYVVTAVNAVGESVDSTQVSATTQGSTAGSFKMPDTGQTMDTTTTFGEDSDYTINAPSYTDNGDGTITDDVTTLVWQKQDDGVTKNWADAITYCDNLTLGGQTNWRLPSRLELVSLIDNGTSNPAVNTTYFPNTSSYIYRTSTKYGGSASDSWGVNFSFGVTGGYMDDATTYVRCVQGGQSAPQSLTDNGNGMVTDNGTHLMWQQGESSSTTWEEALYTCETSTLAGYTDWRLPNFKELLSLVDDTRYRPSNNIAMFPNAISDYYWTSTTYAINSSYASCVFFEYGFPNYINKTFFNNVRCVRGGQ